MYALVNIGVNRMALAAYGYEGLKKYQGPLMSIGSIVAAVASPVVGIMFDRTGSFRPYFLMLVGIMSLCMVLTGVVARMRAKDGCPLLIGTDITKRLPERRRCCSGNLFYR